jgi:cysteine sulfinate desulfinase/cysteine desulfurase-like protein
MDDARARASVRIAFGRFTTEAEVEFAADALAAAVGALRDETLAKSFAVAT